MIIDGVRITADFKADKDFLQQVFIAYQAADILPRIVIPFHFSAKTTKLFYNKGNKND